MTPDERVSNLVMAITDLPADLQNRVLIESINEVMGGRETYKRECRQKCEELQVQDDALMKGLNRFLNFEVA